MVAVTFRPKSVLIGGSVRLIYRPKFDAGVLIS
jgi:hypothetical protein